MSSEFGTTPIFSDNFQQDFAQGQAEPSSTSWNLDNWGSCGNGTLSQDNSNDGGPGTTNYDIDGINPDRNAYLTSNGLAITAIPAGGDAYASAQVDSQPNANGASDQGFSSAYGMVEASIEMPQASNGQPAQGLCPGFWMLGDNDIPGSSIPGEIDVIEAPSFGGGLGNPAYFDLHGTEVDGTTQQYSQIDYRRGQPGWRLPHLLDRLDAEHDHLVGRRHAVLHGKPDRAGRRRVVDRELRHEQVPSDLHAGRRRLALRSRDMHAADLAAGLHDVCAVGEVAPLHTSVLSLRTSAGASPAPAAPRRGRVSLPH